MMGDYEYISRQQVRQFDIDAVNHTGINSLVLMENASRQCADVIDALTDDGRFDGKNAAILAGSGNNGGDGFALARHLAIRGYFADVFLLCDAGKISGDAEANLAIWKKVGGKIIDCRDFSASQMSELWGSYDFLVDALGGTGITPPLRGALVKAVGAANGCGKPIIAIDIPTGMDCDSGQRSGECIKATATVTFVAAKQGFAAAGAKDYTGEIFVADIGISPEMLEKRPK